MLSDVVADRIVELRKAAGITREELAERCKQLGAQSLTVDALANIETGRRHKTTKRRRRKTDVDELGILALALGVPPPWLTVDPRAPTVQIAEGIEVDPWTALAWMSGLNPLEETSSGAGLIAYRAINHLNTLVRLLEQYRMFCRMLDMPMVPAHGDQVAAEPGMTTLISDDIGEARRQAEEATAQTLRRIADRLGQFRALQLSIPELPSDVRRHAAELGIELPSQ